MSQLDRRQFLISASAVSAAGAAAVATSLAVPARAKTRALRPPNVLFIMADDLGYADLSCYGQPNYTTPTLDRLAHDGLKLSQGYANSAVCSATRTALVTGRYQYRVASGLQEPIASMAPQGLPAGTPTIASIFSAGGYRTALVGKWHVGTMPAFSPKKAGYDYHFCMGAGGADFFQHRATLTSKVSGDGLWENEQPTDRDGYLTDIFADVAIEQINAAGTQPFFMSLHFNAPHWPWEGPDDREVSKHLKEIRHLDGGNLATYARMVKSMDDNIARVLRSLQRKGLADNTIVVFTSDNGGERFSDVWPFTGTKGELFEGGIRVPLIVRWPGHIKASSTSQQVMVSMDFMPTLLGAAGLAPDPAYPSDGANLLATLLGSAPLQPRSLYWRFKGNQQAAHRDGDLKYVKVGSKEHLFNVVEDARERAELKEKMPEQFARLKAAYAAWDASMLPYPAESYSEDVKLFYPDRY
jgi:arylsulfatase A-like enzyme